MRITESKKITDFFGCYVFNDSVMKKYLTEDAYNELKEVIDRDKVLEKELANKVAEAMKEWSTENGATHYTHWFQPLTGTTAEKHDSFISVGKKRRDNPRIHRQQPAQRRSGRFQFSFRRYKGDFRSPRIHGMGLFVAGVHQKVQGRRRGAVHTDGILFVHGRGSR